MREMMREMWTRLTLWSRGFVGATLAAKCAHTGAYIRENTMGLARLATLQQPSVCGIFLESYRNRINIIRL
jgi:hypothetical protein